MISQRMPYPGDNQGTTGESVVYAYHNQMSLSTLSASPPYSQTYLASTAYDDAGRVVGRGEWHSPKQRYREPFTYGRPNSVG